MITLDDALTSVDSDVRGETLCPSCGKPRACAAGNERRQTAEALGICDCTRVIVTLGGKEVHRETYPTMAAASNAVEEFYGRPVAATRHDLPLTEATYGICVDGSIVGQLRVESVRHDDRRAAFAADMAQTRREWGL